MATSNMKVAFTGWTNRGITVLRKVAEGIDVATTALKLFSEELAGIMPYSKASTDAVQAAITLMVVESMPDDMRNAYKADKSTVKTMTDAEKTLRKRGTGRVSMYPARIMQYAYGKVTAYESDLLALMLALEAASKVLTKESPDGTVPSKDGAALQKAISGFCVLDNVLTRMETEQANAKLFKAKPVKKA